MKFKKLKRITKKITTSIMLAGVLFGAVPINVVAETIESSSSSEPTGVVSTSESTSETGTIAELENDLLDEIADEVQQSGGSGESPGLEDGASEENIPAESSEANSDDKTDSQVTTQTSEVTIDSVKQGEIDAAKEIDDIDKVTRDVDFGLKDKVTVDSWSIYGDDAGEPLTATNVAKNRESYSFTFNWSLDLKNDKLVNGDFFVLPLPENKGWGFWSAVPGTEIPLEMLDTETNTMVQIGTWKVVHVADGTSRGVYCVRADFTKISENQIIHQVTGADFTLPNNSLKNETSKGGRQQVTFGGIDQTIGFEQLKAEINAGWDHKWASRTGNSNIIYNIGVGRASAVELAGDYVDFPSNKNDGFFLDGNAMGKYSWGQHMTDVDDVYVEDELEAGTAIEELTISAVTHIPIGLSVNENRDSQKGNLVQRDRASEAYVLKDYGNGPVYHVDGGKEAILDPKTPAQSFSKITQATDDSLASFRQKVKSAPYQYGIYKAKDGTQTVLAYFGNVGSNGSGADKFISYHDLTIDEYSDEARSFIRKSDGKEIKVPKFAEDAADYCIASGFYDTDLETRQMLEEYFTLTYGKENAVKGQVVSFNLDINLRYPPNADFSITHSNTAKLYYQSALYQHGIEENKKEYYSVTDKAKMASPYGNISINNNAILLVKYDGVTNKEMNGVGFTLQKYLSGKWVDHKVTSNGKETADHTTATIEVPTKNGQTEKLAGAIYVTGLTNGTYRFVEHKASEGDPLLYPEGYNQKLSPQFDDIDSVISGSYTINGTKAPDMQFVENNPDKEVAPYVVEHWLLKKGKDNNSVNPDDYYLHPIVDNIDGSIKKAIGSTFTAKPRTGIPAYSYKKGHKLEKVSGKITAVQNSNKPYTDPENGQLVLKLYYIKDPDNLPFTIHKKNTGWLVMPSVDEQGIELAEDRQVHFEVYRWNTQHSWDDNGNADTIDPRSSYVNDTETSTNKNAWIRMTKDTDGNSLTPIKTDYAGRIRINLPLGPTGGNYIYALVETKTYSNYKLSPGWWVVYSAWSETEKTALITGVYNRGGATRTANNVKGYEGQHIIFNDPENKLRLYKGDADGDLMPSDENDPNKQVEFEIFEYDWTGDHEQGIYDENGNVKQGWKKIATRQTDQNGNILDEGFVKYNVYTGEPELRTFGLVEKRSYAGYQVPKGYWIIWTGVNNQQGFRVKGVNYRHPDENGVYHDLNPQDKDHPGQLHPDEAGNPTITKDEKNGYFVIGNKLREPFKFSFIKEGQNEDPLGEVEFELYQGQFGKKLIMDTADENCNVHLDDPDSYWIKEPIKNGEELISEGGGKSKGLVEMELEHGNYLLVETKTFKGYQLPDGYWVLQVDLTKDDPGERFKITAIGSPPAFRIDKTTDPNNWQYFLPNFKEYTLPDAGAMSMPLSVIAGITIMGCGVLYYLLTNENKRKKARVLKR